MKQFLCSWPARPAWLVGWMLLSSDLLCSATDYFVNIEYYGFLNIRFNPNNLVIQAGDTVTWVNQDSTYMYYYHSATCRRNGQVVWSTGHIGIGDQSPPMTFPYADTYSYVDDAHSSTTGTIVVQAPPPVPGTLVGAQMRPDGYFQFSVSNLVVNSTYMIQSSTNLVNWTSLVTNQAAASMETWLVPAKKTPGGWFFRTLHL